MHKAKNNNKGGENKKNKNKKSVCVKKRKYQQKEITSIQIAFLKWICTITKTVIICIWQQVYTSRRKNQQIWKIR